MSSYKIKAQHILYASILFATIGSIMTSYYFYKIKKIKKIKKNKNNDRSTAPSSTFISRIYYRAGYVPTAQQKLFNTTFTNVTVNSTALLQTKNIENTKITYSRSVSQLPKTADLRTLWKSTKALDQAACGSCWAFASADMFTDRIRHGLWINTKGSKTLLSTPFFKNVTITTGETKLEFSPNDKTLVNVDAKIYSENVIDRISPYYVATFTPQLKDNCNDVDSPSCIDNVCENLSNVLTKTDLKNKCLGCFGNNILMPLLLFTQKGAARISQYGLEDWACAFGDKSLCRPPVKDLKLYTSSQYMYRSLADVAHITQNLKDYGITTFYEWMMMEIYERGPITITIDIYNSFFTFYSDPKNKDAIFMQKDVKHNDFIQGAHAVSIDGWGERDGIPYWIIRNSWGESWNTAGGYFLLERGKNFCRAEDDMACVMLSNSDYKQFY